MSQLNSGRNIANSIDTWNAGLEVFMEELELLPERLEELTLLLPERLLVLVLALPERELLTSVLPERLLELLELLPERLELTLLLELPERLAEFDAALRVLLARLAAELEPARLLMELLAMSTLLLSRRLFS